MRKFILFLFLGVFLIYSVSALGITPARTTIQFSPGLEQTVSFTVVNSEYKEINLAIVAQGELNETIYIPVKKINMHSNEEARQVEYSFRLPDSLSPGKHSADIAVIESSNSPEISPAFVGATAAVVTQLVVNVPYPGKYAQADLTVINAEQGGAAKFIIPVVSLGVQDLNSVIANIDIYDSLGEKIDSFNTDEVSIPSGKRVDIVKDWIANVSVGNYRAVGTIIYDGETLTIEKNFAVGTQTLELQQVIVKDFSLGEIAKFEMIVANKWSEQISGVYAQTKVFNINGQTIAEFKSPTQDIPALQKTVMVSYWDTAGIQEGEYNASISLKYGSKYSDQNVVFKISQNNLEVIGLGYVISSGKKSGNNSIIFVLATVIAVLVLMNVAWFLVFRKRIKKNKK